MTADTGSSRCTSSRASASPRRGRTKNCPSTRSLGGGEGYDYGWSGPGAPPLFRPVEPAPAPGSWEPSGDVLLPEETAGQNFSAEGVRARR